MANAKTILYVDDDADDLHFLQETFEAFPEYRLHSVSTGVALMEYLAVHAQEVCLVILDINLPVQNGIELLAQLRDSETYRRLPVVMFTTGANSPQAKQLHDMNVDVFEKPATFGEMQKIAQQFLSYCHAPEKKSAM